MGAKSKQGKSAAAKSAAAAKQPEPPAAKSSAWLQLKLLATVLAFALRFWRLEHPDQVVFDEVHFGKFASHYLQHEYYFDLHPPLAKLMFAGVGWLVGYDGSFKFENIGENYITNKVPYLAYRSLPALLGAATVPLVFGTLENCGFSLAACFLGASIITFDTAQIAQTRLILLDAALVFFMAAAVYAYVKFRQQRHAPFGLKWWAWLLTTGVALSSVLSTKYVGLLTYLMIGVAVLADLYNLLDIRGKPIENRVSLRAFCQHFTARFWALIVLPLIIYLGWFYVHFAILTNSGPGDSHMSADFQATLQSSPVAREALDINFYDIVTIQSHPSKVYLHSHPEHYPLQYDDGRISSQGQQVTGYNVPDENNLWQILPPADLAPEDQANHPIVGSQQIRLRHVGTNTYLLTHDVASPSFPTNEEITTVSPEIAMGERYEDTLFYLDILGGGELARTKLSQFRIKHVNTHVAVWLSDQFLPEWGFGQFEVNGAKNLMAVGTTWFFGDIASLPEEDQPSRRSIGDGTAAPRRPFWKDYLELQFSMFRANNQLTATHPYMSSPWEWPLMLRGISFWTGQDNKSQIYLIGNFVGWYLELLAIALFAVLFVIDQVAELRDYDWAPEFARRKLRSTLLWFFVGWSFHYLPFFLMGRQLFLHHYLPAQVIAALIAGGMVDFALGQVDSPTAHLKVRRSTFIVVSLMVAALVSCFIFFAPLVYGMPLSPEQVRARQFHNTQLHFNKS